MERRVILDLSCPKGNSINDYVTKDSSLGDSVSVVYPRADSLVELIKAKGQGCYLFKKDLRKAFRQLKICPSSYNLVALV